ncbi:hypothetical protein HRbin17_02534 [bacterium HR17]|uniref:Uncharacterized protein n=1 Tax=Candidatus Fervidibacter japonicus TaxID=2035412 RepID=A0A2H5XFQ9_9BACT|nr:hypothetical protein HRbin17_02534 [bacterium HR17]
MLPNTVPAPMAITAAFPALRPAPCAPILSRLPINNAASALPQTNHDIVASAMKVLASGIASQMNPPRKHSISK